MDWDKLRIFHAVADAGSLTHAGDSLHLSQSAVSRQIRALEEQLNTTLFHRHARGLILTEQGAKRRASIHLLRGREALDDFDRGGLEVATATPEQARRPVQFEYGYF